MAWCRRSSCTLRFVLRVATRSNPRGTVAAHRPNLKSLPLLWMLPLLNQPGMISSSSRRVSETFSQTQLHDGFGSVRHPVFLKPVPRTVRQLRPFVHADDVSFDIGHNQIEAAAALNFGIFCEFILHWRNIYYRLVPNHKAEDIF